MKYYNMTIGNRQCYLCITETDTKPTFSLACTSMHEKKRRTIENVTELHELVVSAYAEQKRLLDLAPVQKLIMDRATRVKLAEFVGADVRLIDELRSGGMSPAETKLINLEILIKAYEAWKNKTMLWEWRECNQETLDLISATEFVDAIYDATCEELEVFNNVAVKESVS